MRFVSMQEAKIWEQDNEPLLQKIEAQMLSHHSVFSTSRLLSPHFGDARLVGVSADHEIVMTHLFSQEDVTLSALRSSARN